MKKFFGNFAMAFHMYSKIPMPQVSWTKENREYALCFFPFVGIIIGIICLFWNWICIKYGIGVILRTCVYLIIPVLITGGIHLDGFIDTCDALHSYQDREKKLEILKDPHVGAFAIISIVVYYILALGIWSEVNQSIIFLLALSFSYSRILSALSIYSFPKAKNTGLAAAFSESAVLNKQKTIMHLLLAACCGAFILIDVVGGIICIAAGGVIYLYYKRTAIKNFGGITGDLAGFFLQVCELAIAFSMVVYIHIM